MPALTELKGKDMGRQRVRIEWGPAKTFAVAVTDSSPEHQAEDAIVPPTFPFAWGYWGTLEGRAGGLPIEQLRGPGRMILHGEQEFEYHRHARVGDVLEGTARIADVYERDTGSATMEFYVLETSWTDASSGEPVVDARFTLIVRAKNETPG
ncbi:MAG: MaoC family dehydratase N-terminal domain-containing protein [Actinomycetota bacterium]|nr:MaoC family dehydratase N-terminal domain-containing protein [Acidimicrobiia bacterium]MDQ3294026.1 MaoC family dehydratase N-terminal domain-containing protein [Actinomycetota bacterium]